MKRLFLALFVLIQIYIAHGQKLNPPEKSRFIIVPSIELKQVTSQTAVLGGLAVEEVFRSRLGIGIFAKYMLNSGRSEVAAIKGASVKVWAIGASIGFYPFKDAMFIDPYIDLQLGQIVLITGNNGTSKDHSPYIVPSIKFEKLVAPFIRVGVGVNYSMTATINMYYKNSDVSGLGAVFYCKILLY